MNRLRRSVPFVGGAFVLVGAVLVVGMLAVPEQMQSIYGNTKVAIESKLHDLIAPNELPLIDLGGEGGIPELDACTGEFTEMMSYREADVLPLFAAHNNCGGDVILGWDIGQQVRVVGDDTIYEVVDERHTPKWSNVETLEGMPGEFMLQTCYYGENKMRFLSLAPVEQ